MTDEDGIAECTFRPNILGETTIYAHFDGDDEHAPVKSSFKIITKPQIKTYIEYIGDTEGFTDKPITLKAKVYYLDENKEKHYMKDRTILFKANSESIKKVSLDSSKVASCQYTAKPHLININIHSLQKDSWDVYAQCRYDVLIPVYQCSMEKKLYELLDGNQVDIGILGSCASRTMFSTELIPTYKRIFNLKWDFQRSSFISLVQPPVTFKQEDLTVLPKNKINNKKTVFVKQDLEKTFLKKYKEQKVEYLLMDLEFEAQWGCLCATTENGENIIITNNLTDIPLMELNNKLTNKRKFLLIGIEGEQYFDEWKKACDKLFKFIKKHNPNVKIILNPVKQVYEYKQPDGSIIINEKEKEYCIQQNPLLEKLEQYIIDNYDVHVIKKLDELYCDTDHMLGPCRVHYTRDFYESLYQQLLNIIYFDKL